MMGFGSDNKHSGNQSESRRVVRNFISTPSSSPLSRFADRKMEIMKTVGVLLLVAWAAPRTAWRPSRGTCNANGQVPCRVEAERRAAAGCLGARLRQYVHGHLVGDGPRAAAGLPRRRARHIDIDGRLHRRYRRSDGKHHEDLLGRTVRLARQAQAADEHRLWSCSFHQADLSACCHGRLGGRGALH